MIRRALWGLLALLAIPAPARAHGLQAEARFEGGQVVLELFFSDGTPPASAQVVVLRGDAEVARGASDERGVYRFRPPAPGTYVLRATEPGLHRAEATVEVPEATLTPSPGASPPGPPAPPPAARGATPWGRIAIGLGVIVLLAVGLSFAQRRGPAPPDASEAP